MLGESIVLALVCGSILLNIHLILKSTCQLCYEGNGVNFDSSLDVDFSEEKRDN